MKKNDIKYEMAAVNQKVSLDNLKIPLYMYIKINNFCNFNCVFCSRNIESMKEISLENFKFLIDQLLSIGIKDIYLTGGEPLLHSKFDELLTYALSKEMSISVLTNGILINNYFNNLKKVKCVSVSLHGNSKTHNEIVGVNCYDIVTKNILQIKKHTSVTVNYTAFSKNLNEKNILSVYDFCESNNIPMNISRYNDLGCGKTNHCVINLNSFAKTLDNLIQGGCKIQINNCIAPCTVDDKYLYLTHGCGAGYLFGCVDYNLDVKICSSSQTSLGNLKRNSFRRIWNQKKMKDFRSLRWIPIQCKTCINLARCKCGCKSEMSENLLTMNDKNVVDHYEKIWKKIKNKSFYVNVATLRKDNKQYINLSPPARIFNLTTKDLLIKIQKTEKIVTLSKYKDLIVLLYKEGIIREKNDK